MRAAIVAAALRATETICAALLGAVVCLKFDHVCIYAAVCYCAPEN